VIITIEKIKNEPGRSFLTGSLKGGLLSMSYRMGEVARLLGTSEHTLRYYEKVGLVVPERNHNKIRFYTEEK
jgi:hypothetical protein